MKLSHLASLVLSIAPLIQANPITEDAASDIAESNGVFARDAPFKGKDLKILPLGASITSGHGSTDKNGYRKRLLDKIEDGNTIKYIGSLKTGSMENNENEGHSGKKIADMAGFAETPLKEKPNVVLLFVGTNDMTSPTPKAPADKAPERLGVLIDDIVKAVPDAAVLVAQITALGNKDQQTRVEAYDKAIPGVVKKRADNKKHVLVVDMSDTLQQGDYIKDHEHPNDAGYEKIANAWVKGLKDADAKGWLD